MTEVENKLTRYVKVVDRSGKEYVCPLSALKDPNHVTEEELKNCFDSVEDAFSDAEVLAIIKSELRKD
ncbi:MAG: hypothetical protein ACLP5H_02700 [Desulfomonilaceae bacterium]